MQRLNVHALAFRERGFTLIELMISVTIGMLILAAMTAMLVNNSAAQAEIEKANRQVENGRYAFDLLSADLRNAGYYGEFDPTVLTAPLTMPDPCLATIADFKAALPLYVQGYDNVAANVLSCLSDVKPGTDIVVVRHTATCVIDAGNCNASGSGGPYFQASLCNNATELSSSSVDDFYALANDIASLDRHQRDCTSVAGSGTLAVVRRLEIHLYFVANNGLTTDGIPTLKRARLANNGGSLGVTIEPLVEGIENLQMEYGLDTNSDGAADVFTTSPASHAGCVLPACAVTNWTNVVSTKVNLLARNLEPSLGHIDRKSYVLGNLSDGSPNTIAATGDQYKRHVYQALGVLWNPAGRKAP